MGGGPGVAVDARRSLSEGVWHGSRSKHIEADRAVSQAEGSTTGPVGDSYWRLGAAAQGTRRLCAWRLPSSGEGALRPPAP